MRGALCSCRRVAACLERIAACVRAYARALGRGPGTSGSLRPRSSLSSVCRCVAVSVCRCNTITRNNTTVPCMMRIAAAIVIHTSAERVAWHCCIDRAGKVRVAADRARMIRIASLHNAHGSSVAWYWCIESAGKAKSVAADHACVMRMAAASPGTGACTGARPARRAPWCTCASGWSRRRRRRAASAPAVLKTLNYMLIYI